MQLKYDRNEKKNTNHQQLKKNPAIITKRLNRRVIVRL